MIRSYLLRIVLLAGALMALYAADANHAAQAQAPVARPILLRSRRIVPPAGVEAAARAHLSSRGNAAGHVIVQFDELPTEAARSALAARGIRLLDYLPERAYFAAVPPSAVADLAGTPGLHWVGAIEPGDRMAATLKGRRPAQAAAATVSLYVRYFADVDEAAARAAVARNGGLVDASDPALQMLTIRIAEANIAALAGEDGLRWLTPAAPTPTPALDTVRAKMRVNDVQAAPYSLTGTGVMLGIWDCGPVAAHIDFDTRLISVPGEVDVNCGTNWHSTHVAGIMAGSGLNSATYGGTAYQWKGIAPGAGLASYNYATTPVPPYNELQPAINSYGLDISNNSWGFPPVNVTPPALPDCSPLGAYTSGLWTSQYDQMINGLLSKRLPIVFSAGNERQNWPTCSPTGYYTVISPGTAKNVMTVGATDVYNDVYAPFSSWGPTDDGRIKPDVVAPGYRADTPTGTAMCTSSPPYTGGIMAPCPNSSGYGFKVGTSMSAPAVSGMYALMLQQYRQITGLATSMLWSSTFKALAIQGAIDLGNPDNLGPDYVYGWGRVDAKNSVDLVKYGRWREDIIAGGSVLTYTANVLSCDTQIKATLAWDDVAGTDNAAKELVNDLDLTLIDPSGGTYYPWVLSPGSPSSAATRGVDSANNVEQVLVNSPQAGRWTIRVTGALIPNPPAQRFSVVSEALNTPTLASVSAMQAQPGDTLLLHGTNFEQGCSVSPLVVNFGGGVTMTVASNAFTRDTITVTVPANAQSGAVSVTTPAATSNGLYVGVIQPQVYMPAIMRNWPPAFNWLDAGSGTRLFDPVDYPGTTADDATQTIPLPFPFRFYGNVYTTTTVSSNGFIGFGSLLDSYPQHDCLPSVAAPNNAIYGYWVDLVPNDVATTTQSYARAVWSKLVNGLFVIEWQEVPRYGVNPPAVETFEIVLYPQGYIVLQYLDVNDTADVSVGIENSTGDRVTQLYCNISATNTTFGSAPAPGTLWALIGN